MDTRFGRVLAAAYLIGLPMAWGSFVPGVFFGDGRAIQTFGFGCVALAVTALDLRWRDPSVIERDKSRPWPISSSWLAPPAGWLTALGDVMLGRQVRTAWSVLRAKSHDDQPPRPHPKSRQRKPEQDPD